MKAFAHAGPSLTTSADLTRRVGESAMKYTDRQRRTDCISPYGTQHAECIYVAYSVAQINHRLQVMRVDQAADTFVLVCHHWRR
jgi:hypothetical protein